MYFAQSWVYTTFILLLSHSTHLMYALSFIRKKLALHSDKLCSQEQLNCSGCGNFNQILCVMLHANHYFLSTDNPFPYSNLCCASVVINVTASVSWRFGVLLLWTVLAASGNSNWRMKLTYSQMRTCALIDHIDCQFNDWEWSFGQHENSVLVTRRLQKCSKISR